jgi:hypothetical protein
MVVPVFGKNPEEAVFERLRQKTAHKSRHALKHRMGVSLQGLRTDRKP